MSENDLNKSNPDENPESDEDFDSLSPDEKAAFEKIMAEIATETGDAPSDEDAASDSGSNAGDGAAVEAVEAITDENSAAADPADDAGLSGAQNEQGLAQTDEPSDPENSNATENDPADKDATTDTSQVPADDTDALTEEQQSALDQIMSEINSKNGGQATPSTVGDSVEDPPDEDLTEEQQAALDKIMSEISSRASDAESEQKTEEADPENDDDLTSDQKSALDSIMSEIESKKLKDVATLSDAEEEPAADQGDQDEALKNIMAEIEERKKIDHTAGAEDEKDLLETESVEAGASGKTEDLSLDEFNKELTELLSGGQKDSEEQTENKSKDKKKSSLSDLLGEHKEESTPEKPEKRVEIETSAEATASKETTEDKSDEYVYLREVDPSEQTETVKTGPKKAGKQDKVQNKTATPVSKKAIAWTAAVVSLLVIAGSGYWWYHQKEKFNASVTWAQQSPSHAVSPAEPALTQEQSPGPKTAPQRKEPPASLSEMAAPVEQKPPAQAQAVLSIQKLTNDLDATRAQFLSKIKEILELKIYYQQGIEEEAAQIAPAIIENQITAMPQALRNSKIELAMRSIQRRMTYLKKLDVPLEILTSASEELLYIKRRGELYSLLTNRVSSFPADDYKEEAQQLLEKHQQTLADLSIESVDMQPPPLELAWRQLIDKTKNVSKTTANSTAINARNRSISNQMCNGNFENKYQLTVLLPETAECLLKWTGKDLYLNNLTALSAETAKILSQWSGEWLSLNGLKELSADAAGFLSQWTGKRLSLNGLTRLSPEATAHLSAWRGEQLELVGLESIGRWENYGTRLFLSENLKRKLEGR